MMKTTTIPMAIPIAASTRQDRRAIRGPSRRGITILLLLLALVTTAAAISQVWTRLQVIQYGYKISEASKERSKLREKNRRLRVEIAVLKNPARIAQIASEQFGLQQPLPKQIHRLRPAGEGAAPALVRAPR